MSFCARLAIENGWSKAFARRTLEEYKKFLYLCVAFGDGCTPSDEVDQVWHLHLSYTKSYWRDLCPNVLEKPLHHNPTEGGPAEDAKYQGKYLRTLERYKAEFGQYPPADIWPDVHERFKPLALRSQQKRIDTDRYLLIPKQPAQIVVFTLAFSLLISGYSYHTELVTDTQQVLALFIVLLAMCIIGVVLFKIFKGKGDGGGKGDGPAGSCGGTGCAGGSGCGGGCGD